MRNRPIRVLVVDDSAYLRKAISESLERHPLIEVVGVARDGNDALEKVAELSPDVVTLDVYMPELDGVGFLRAQMARKPLPVVICSIADEAGTDVLAALDAGAFEFVQKPTALANEKVYQIMEELAQKVIAAGSIAPEKLPQPAPLAEPGLVQPAGPLLHVNGHARRAEVLVLGISTGGPQALRYLLPRLPGDFPVPIAIVLHMPPGYTGPFAERLNALSQLEVLEAADGLEMLPGRAILARAGCHLSLERLADGRVVARLADDPEDSLHRPSVDVLFRSAADIYGAGILGVIMTGMGEDGLQGAAWIKAHGGSIITESESSCIIYGMPRAVDQAGLSDRSVSLEEMAEAILEAL